jgi:3,4-dihydroxy 2-butanone 4-phosphate synthase/GTP cyclohydrolase II
VAAFAVEHGLKQVSVADLIAYRQRKETLIDRVASFDITTDFGAAKVHTYSLPWDPMQHLAVVFGDIRDGENVLVRLHMENVAGDVFAKGRPVEKFMKRIGEERRGIIIYLREGSVGVGATEHNRKLGHGRDATVEGHAQARERENEWLEIGLGAQILKHLGVSSIRILSSRERHYVGLEGFGINIAETEII